MKSFVLLKFFKNFSSLRFIFQFTKRTSKQALLYCCLGALTLCIFSFLLDLKFNTIKLVKFVALIMHVQRLRRLGGGGAQQLIQSHQYKFLKVLGMISQPSIIIKSRKIPNILALIFEHFSLSLYKAFHLRKIDKVYKWPWLSSLSKQIKWLQYNNRAPTAEAWATLS